MRLEVAAAVGLLLTTTVTAYQIFAFEPSPGHSHWNVMSTALESLLDAGHVVVCVTMHRATGRLAGNPNYTHIDASKSMGESLINLNYSDLMRLSENLTRMAMHVEQLSCNALTELSDVRDLLLDDGRPRFDVVFLDSMYSECSKALFSRLGLPVAYVIPCPLGDWITPTVFGSAGHMSYVQHALHVVPPVPKTFGQRVAIAVHYVYTNLVRWRLDVDYSSYPEPRNSIVFINTHYSLEPVAPMGLEVHEIGGIHLRPPKPLSRDLAELLDNSGEYGVIVISFGSVVSINSLPDNVLDVFKSVFSQLPQTVICKYENDYMPGKPENVQLFKWLPQRDLLKHPNVKLFISHCGISGMYETVDAGVPVLGVPFFFDQLNNVKNLVNHGMALHLDVNNITKMATASAIRRLLYDRSFSENAKRLSSLFRDRPMTPADSVVYWTEHLIRHGAATNVRPPTADTSWISDSMIDLYTAVTVTIIGLWLFTRAVLHGIVRGLNARILRISFRR